VGEEQFPIWPFLSFLVILAVFLLPGYGWVSWLHRADRFPIYFRLVLGFAWSLGLFSLLGGPFLWYRRSFVEFLTVLYPWWAVYMFGGMIAYIFSLRRTPGNDVEPLATSAAKPRGKIPDGLRLLLYGYVGLAAGVVWVSAARGPDAWLTAALVSLTIWGSVLAWRLRQPLAERLQDTAADAGRPPWPWTAVAVGLIGFQAVSAVIYYRPDWDDCFTLAAVLDYEHATVLNEQEFTHHEGFPVDAAHRTMCWELWGAVVCRLSGTTPLVVFHSFLPALLVLGAYAAYSGLLAQFLPRHWVPLALIGLSGYFLWGISSHWTAANHLLVRIWQGKSVLLHLIMPLIVVMVCRFAQRLKWAYWLSLLAVIVAGLGASSSAIFLEGILVSCLALAVLPTRPGGYVRFLGGIALVLLPAGLVGLAVRAAVGGDLGMDIPSAPEAAASRWLAALAQHIDHGSAEVIWVVTLPFLALLLANRRRQAYLVAFPLILLLTFANPLLCGLVMNRVTTAFAYQRILWLFPVGPGMGALMALVARQTGSGCTGRAAVLLPLGVCGLGVAGMALFFPGRYVWSANNNYTPFMVPRRAENLEKMPADLLSIARILAADPAIDHGRILCNEEVSSFLTPCSNQFRFVVTRTIYTLSYLGRAGRAREAGERCYLYLVVQGGSIALHFDLADRAFLNGYLGPKITAELFESSSLPSLKDVPALLDRYCVRYIVASPPPRSPQESAPAPAAEEWRAELVRQRAKLFEQLGYEPAYHGREYVLWQRRAID
jgi:hypothetical protein